MRTADIVYHRPSEETWLVAWVDEETGDMAPCGWPTCQARIDDCEVIKVASDEEHRSLVEKVANSGRTDAGRARRIADDLLTRVSLWWVVAWAGPASGYYRSAIIARALQ